MVKFKTNVDRTKRHAEEIAPAVLKHVHKVALLLLIIAVIFLQFYISSVSTFLWFVNFIGFLSTAAVMVWYTRLNDRKHLSEKPVGSITIVVVSLLWPASLFILLLAFIVGGNDNNVIDTDGYYTDEEN